MVGLVANNFFMSGQDVVQSLVSFVFTEILRKWVLFLSSLLHTSRDRECPGHDAVFTL